MAAPGPLISVISPTFNRPEVLPHLYHSFATQDCGDRELLVADDSPTPNATMQAIAKVDSRVRYIHSPERLSIGQKRNRLIEEARGDIIVHFDDDDFYAPSYVSTMLTAMGEHDMVKLSAWYNFSPPIGMLAYWDCHSKVPIGFSMSPGGQLDVVQNAEHPGNTWGFGFSYVYRRRMWDAVRFDDRSFGEDYDFVTRAFAAGFKGVLHADQAGIALHIIHSNNTSRAFPQFLLPPFLIGTLFGDKLRAYGAAQAFLDLKVAK
jgi:glycosyltransferase involved in cell wall biosynthesis